MDIPFDVSDDSGLNDNEDSDMREIALTQEEQAYKDSDTLLVETVYNFPALYNKELKDYHIPSCAKTVGELFLRF